MGLNIKNEEVVAGIRRLAELRGVSLTEAVDQAVKAALGDAAEARRRDIESRRQAVERITARLALIPRGSKTSTERLDDLYDENGLPA